MEGSEIAGLMRMFGVVRSGERGYAAENSWVGAMGSLGNGRR